MTSNAAELNVRRLALLAALREDCERLQLEPDDAVVLSEIERIKAARPQIETTVKHDDESR